MSILTFGLGTTGQVSSVFGKEVEVAIDEVVEPDIDLNNNIEVNIDTVVEPDIDLIQNIEVELTEEQEIKIDKSCPPG